MSAPTHLEIIPLGGLGEFGMNLMVYRWGTDCLVVDAGMMFPGAEHLGVEVVIPDLSFLEDCGTVHAVLLTHGHEDHIGAVPYLLARRDVPVYATRYTDGLVRRRLTEHPELRESNLRPLPEPGESLSLGPFRVQSLSAAHSIPQARMLVLRTPVGIVVHTADFKLDPNPVEGPGTDLQRLAELGREGVLALMADSTNADRAGFSGSESSVSAGIEPLMATHPGRVLVTTFASHIHRLQQLADLARRHRRRLAFVGSSMQTHTEVAERLGLLRIPAGSRVQPERVMELRPERSLVVVAGTQGEPMSAMARIAVGKHRHIEASPGDLVLHSAREIPGNEKSIGRMVNHFLRRGARVVTAAEAPIHVSGHAHRDELQLLLHLVKPRFLVPIHGEFRQLQALARLAVNAGFESDHVQMADSGDVIALNDAAVGVCDRVHVGQVFIDATLDEVDWTVLRDRQRIAGDGIVVPVVAVDRENGSGGASCEIMTRGFVPDGEDAKLMLEAREVVTVALDEATPEERTDEGVLKARIQTELKRFLRRRTQRRPLVIPVIVEL